MSERRQQRWLPLVCAGAFALALALLLPLFSAWRPTDSSSLPLQNNAATTVPNSGYERLSLANALARGLADGSSVWCTGSDVHDRQCRFRRLCANTETEEFFILHGPDTVVEGVPAARFDPALATLSSLRNHNGVYFNYVDVAGAASLLQQFPADSPVAWIADPAYLFLRFKPNNIMHVLHVRVHLWCDVFACRRGFFKLFY